ncbi:MAG: hypothetical protein GY716_23665 [bacterium]|nr:hypothetical protein [bacterium]
METSGKTYACLLSAAVLLAVISPIGQNWKDRPRDGFPLSHYPMFSKQRADESSVTHLVGIDADGRARPLHAGLTGLSGGMNQSRKQIRRIARAGKAPLLCREAAARVAESSVTEQARIREIRVITGSYRLSEYFRGQRQPVTETVHAVCRITR